MAGATLLWGATFIVIRDAVASVAPVTLVFTRFAIATPVLFAIALLTGRKFTRAAWIGGGLAGGIAALAFALQAAGLRHTSAGTSAFLTALGTLFAGVFAWPLLRQRPGAELAWAMLLAAAGAALLTGVRGLSPGTGAALSIAGAVAFALQIVALARFAPEADPLALTAVQAGALALATAPFAIGRLDPALFAGALGPRLAYLVLAGSVVAPLLQVMAQRSLSAARTGLLLGLEPVFATIFAVTLGGEHPVPGWWSGAALILVAVLLAESRDARASRDTSRRASGQTAA